MANQIATAKAHPNIAFIKYWGNRDHRLRLPENGSISMNLDGLHTITTVQFSSAFAADQLTVNGQPQTGDVLSRVSQHLSLVRDLASSNLKARVTSENNFPTGTGIASSASAFAALSAAAAKAIGLELSEVELSVLARKGSGSACRSVPAGYVEWYVGHSDDTSYAELIASPDHWNLVDLVAVVSSEHKAVGSTGGHTLAGTSPLQAARVDSASSRIERCRTAIIQRDFEALAEVVEHDALIMHGVMMTSRPPLLYWLPPTLGLMHQVIQWRGEGVPACFTIDAGPNVHIITTSDYADGLKRKIEGITGVKEVLTALPGGSTTILDTHLGA
jgi:diphosphomevalonate decarboxylase